ncbi:MLO-like protein 3 isoform X2 [Malania oleifera]|nr:MLO-like protein 3 isoform X2 [Malania oleifera]
MVVGGGGKLSSSSTTPTRSLQDTPTWALATVCFVFISVSIFIEHLIHLLSHWLKNRRKTSLFEAVEKLKLVLMLLGFMSLILAVTQRPISKLCIPNKVASTMLPCRTRLLQSHTTEALRPLRHHDDDDQDYYTRTNQYQFHHLISPSSMERQLASATTADTSSNKASADYCASKGMTSFISQDGINQLNIFIFVLAVMQIVYSVLTMALGRAKMRRWKVWEKETQTVEYLAANDPNRFRYTRETTFGRRHMSSFTRTSTQLWIKCFFRQFFNSVAKVDYLTLRHGFISAHLSTNNSFDFQKYIQRTLDDDFKVVVGVSPFMWFVVFIFFLVDVQGWKIYFWVSFVPLILVLILGTKLEVIVAKMALELKNQNNVTRGTPLVQPNDNLFWFSQPKHVLTILHFTLFVNAFEIAFFVWVMFQFGIKSCYLENKVMIITRMVLG